MVNNTVQLLIPHNISCRTLTTPILLIYYIMNYNKTEQIPRKVAATVCGCIASYNIFLSTTISINKNKLCCQLSFMLYDCCYRSRLHTNKYSDRHNLLLCSWYTVSTCWSNLNQWIKWNIFILSISHNAYCMTSPCCTCKLNNWLHKYQPNGTLPLNYPTLVRECGVNKLQ
jgi:hypothetical protein